MTAPGGEWVCEAYPPEVAAYGVLCFFADRGKRNCATVEECAASVAGARQVLAQHMNTPSPLTPDCPGCGEPPMMLMGGGTQAFCGTDDCPWFTWDPTKTLAELNASATRIDFPGGPDPAPPDPDGGNT